RELLLESTGGTVDGPTEPTSTAVRAEPVPTRSHRILLAEDNVVNQMVAKAFLNRLGYRSDCVANGLEALEAVRRGSYDVVLMDVQMPEMDGLEATRRIREELASRRQPLIVAMTAHAMRGDEQRCREAGMDAYLSKPLRINELETVLRQLPEG
ncbi:MAG: response regulator, partial [bacterium]|nr:response regulator [bacterium]